MANARILIPIKDGNGKISTATFPTVAPSDAQITALYNAVDGLVKGKLQGSSFVEETAKDAAQAGLAPGSATRVNKWLCSYQDNTDASEHSLEIATADLDLQASPGNTVDLTAGAGLAFKTAFEAAVKSPVTPGQGGGNAVTLLSVEFVGRNLKTS